MRHYDRAIALDPTAVDIYVDRALHLVAWRGDTLAARRQIDEALAQGNPGRVVARAGVHAALLLGDGPLARAAVRDLHPRDFGHDTTAFLLWHAQWARLHGDHARARRHAERARQRAEPDAAAHPDGWGRRMLLARAYAELGRRDDALRAAGRAVDLAPMTADAIDGQHARFDLAHVAAVVGAAEIALPHLADLLERPTDLTATLLRLDPMWGTLRDHPGFRTLAR